MPEVEIRIRVGRRQLYLPLEHVITYSLTSLFPKMEITECAPFRVTRDADFELSDESEDLLSAIEVVLQQRTKFGRSVRLEVDTTMTLEVLDLLDGGPMIDLERRHQIWTGTLQRIAEDHLRILRFFRFHARFGAGEPDPRALAA